MFTTLLDSQVTLTKKRFIFTKTPKEKKTESCFLELLIFKSRRNRCLWFAPSRFRKKKQRTLLPFTVKMLSIRFQNTNCFHFKRRRTLALVSEKLLDFLVHHRNSLLFGNTSLVCTCFKNKFYSFWLARKCTQSSIKALKLIKMEDRWREYKWWFSCFQLVPEH